ncbi:MAG: discoidin domain-containing protein, partial [Clostridia bacterium]|nr:discoidin domain-containing protein [Clostridia bacterium]
GSETTRLSFARGKDEQWMIVDLGAVYPIRSVEIQFFERVMSYDVFASEDGLTYRKIYGFRGETEDDKKTEHTAYLDAISVGEDVSARYVKYVQNKRWYHSGWSTYYSGGISEFRVYSIDREPYRQLALNAKAAAAKRGAGDLTRRKLALAAVELEEYLLGRHLYAGNLETIADRIADLTNGELTAGPRKGDVNGDGRVSAADCLAVKAQTLRGGAIPEDRLSAADADGDREITAADADAIRKSALKQEPLC